MNYKELDKRFCPPLAWVEIDLAALKHNIKAIQRLAGKDVHILTVVKAQAYGHGLPEIVKVLDKEGIEFFGVSDINEAILIRQLKIKKPIVLLENTLADYADYLVKYHITPVVCTLEFARALNRLGQKRKKKIAVHIKVDTGMGRLGIWQDEAVDFAKMIKRFSWLRVEGLCTHFPVADTDVDFTNKQIAAMAALVEKLRHAIGPIPLVHAANSLGLSAYAQPGFNLVRTGLMLYGLYPSPAIWSKISLKPVMSIKARVCFVKHIFAGRKISYGHTFTAPINMRVATVSIGYSDGYLRIFSNKSFVIIRGVRCPVIGTVTMDQIMVDVTNVNGVKAGDEVCILGRQGKKEVSADELAQIAGTINYEITCHLGNRLMRIYRYSKKGD